MNASPSTDGPPLPDGPRIRELLGALFDGFKVKPAAAVPPASYCAVYVSDLHLPVALSLCDLGFAARAGAALSMLPPSVVQEALNRREADATMLDNLREVMNICARLLLREGNPHLRLSEVYSIGRLPGDAAALLGRAERRADFEVQLGKYGTGHLSVLTC